MSGDPARGVGALALRLVASLLLVGAAIFGALVLALSGLPVTATGGYRLPGGLGTLDSTAFTVLELCSGVLATFAAAAFLFVPRSPHMATRVLPRRGIARPLLVLMAGLFALAAALALRGFGPKPPAGY